MRRDLYNHLLLEELMYSHYQAQSAGADSQVEPPFFVVSRPTRSRVDSPQLEYMVRYGPRFFIKWLLVSIFVFGGFV